MKLCPFCAEEIQDAAIVCKHCGRDLVEKPPAPPPPPPVVVQRVEHVVNTKPKTSPVTFGCAVLAVLALLAFIASMIFGGAASTPSAGPTKPPATAAQAAAEQAAVTADLENFQANPKSVLDQMKALIKAGNYEDAHRLARRYKSVKNRELEELDRQARAQAAAAQVEVARVTGIATRKAFAANAREKFLDAGFDIKVSARGAQADQLIFEFVLFNDAWAHRLEKDGVLSAAHSIGFQRIDMKDGYDYHKYWTWK